MNRKITKEELWKMDIIDVYNLVLRGDIIKIFPNGTWQRPDALNNAKKLLLYIIEQQKLTEEDVLNLSQKWFYNNRLSSPLNLLFNGSPPIYINYVFDNKFNIWDFKIVPNDYWTKEIAKEAFLFKIKEQNLMDKDILSLGVNWFFKNGLATPINHIFNSSPIAYINYVFEDKFNMWDFKNVSLNYWTKETAKEAFLFKIKEQNLTNKDILNLNQKWFFKNGLATPLSTLFNNSPTAYINYVINKEGNNKIMNRKITKEELWAMDIIDVYNLVLRSDIIKTFSKGTWQRPDALNNVKKLLLYIIEKEKLSDKEILSLNATWFRKNKLSSPLNLLFNGSPSAYINYAFEDKFNVWDFKIVPQNYWTKETAKEAFLFKIKEQNLIEEEILNLRANWFRENNLVTPLNVIFGNYTKYINYVFDNKFNIWDFKTVPNDYWTKETAKEAFLFKIKEQNLIEEDILNLKTNWFLINGLRTPLNKLFNNSPTAYINYVLNK